MYPMKLNPTLKNYLWGGERLISTYHKKTNQYPVAESWEVSCHPAGYSTIANGIYTGQTLQTVLAANLDYLGTDTLALPILIKLIDAKDNLSLQVHPDNRYAMLHEGQLGKNEMWYVIDAVPGSTLIIGCTQTLTKQQLRQKIEDNTILEVANYIPVQKGDCFEIPAGMLHAIGAGVLIAEVQQSSNVTYRVYDYNRLDPDGNPRTLHIENAIDVIDTSLQLKNSRSTNPTVLAGGTAKALTDWDWFHVSLVTVETSLSRFCSATSPDSILVLTGTLSLQQGETAVTLSAGESAFCPAGLGSYQFSGQGSLLVTTY